MRLRTCSPKTCGNNHTTNTQRSTEVHAVEFEYAGGWVPEMGDVLIGKVTSLDIGWSKYPPPSGSNYPIVTVRVEEGSTERDGDIEGNGEVKVGTEVAVHCFHAALRNKLMSLQPRAGERIGMQYQGKRPSKSDPSNEVAVYSVRIQGRSADIWAQMAPPQQQAPAPTHGGFVPHDVPASVADFTPPAQDGGDDIPF
jgi:hypothetical protein